MNKEVARADATKEGGGVGRGARGQGVARQNPNWKHRRRTCIITVERRGRENRNQSRILYICFLLTV